MSGVLLLFAGCRNKEMGKSLKELFQTPYFRVVVVPDEETVEMCGALKVCLALLETVEMCGALKVCLHCLYHLFGQ